LQMTRSLPWEKPGELLARAAPGLDIKAVVKAAGSHRSLQHAQPSTSLLSASDWQSPLLTKTRRRSRLKCASKVIARTKFQRRWRLHLRPRPCSRAVLPKVSSISMPSEPSTATSLVQRCAWQLYAFHFAVHGGRSAREI
jgi:hypothetical protein